MATLNEVKEKIAVVRSVGDFSNALQQIAAMRMVALRDQVLSSKRFVDEATEILKELRLYKEMMFSQEYDEANKKSFAKKKMGESLVSKEAIIVVTSNQGLCGKYNAEIFKVLETKVLQGAAGADIYIIGKKGQEHYLANKKYKFNFYPYNVPDNFTSDDLLRLVKTFSHYDRILMIYARYINTITRDVVQTLLIAPPVKEEQEGKDKKVKFIFEPNIDDLINDISSSLRAAAFHQQILDSRLSQYSAQMVGMQAASENAKVMLGDLGHEYNKQRRKMIDKKIGEVFAGSALW
jgi:F-type H+-transporting ATPase subunit gamma